MLTWNEIRTRAAQFTARWADVSQENAEAQTFWNEFLQVYGIDRRRVGQFEKRVDGLSKGSGRGRVDLLWPGLFMAEHKSKGRDLAAATVQALEYVEVLEAHERPQFVAVSDFDKIRLHDVERGEAEEFSLSRLPQVVERFAFLIGKQLRHQAEADPVNVKAAQQMGKLHNLLEESGYQGHALELLLVRLLFLLFGDDTGLWDERGLFYDLLADHTRKDGDDTGALLGRLFQTLNTPRTTRPKNLPAHLDAFPYVNGELFSENINLADFSPKMRQMLLDACTLDWGQVSPAIFGSMFQAVMDEEERRNLGAHYTSEQNILKALGPLFLDELKAMREAARNSKTKLQAFLDLLPKIRLLDPACGSGNFLILAYRELRRLELSALVEQQRGQQVLDLSLLLKVNVGQFYGIEYDEFPSQIARVAMWLTDHQMNLEASHQLGQNFVNLPLSQAAHIRQGDALEVDWAEHLQLTTTAEALGRLYIVGNPPFVGSYLMSPEQKQQVMLLFKGNSEAGVLDYVTAWHLKAAQLMWKVDQTWPQLHVATALVSTNSIVQGEQVPPLWTELLDNFGNVITAAHQTFSWTNDAPGRAAVHCIIVQFQPARTAPIARRLFTYADVKAVPVERDAKTINAYLLDGPQVIVRKQRSPMVTGVKSLVYGNKPADGGHLIFHTQDELDAFLLVEPNAAKFVKKMLDAQDFLRGKMRWCLWLVDAEPAELQKLPKVLERVQKVKKMREDSKSPIIRKFAATPTLFVQRPHVDTAYLAVPRVSSERREYIPFGYMNGETVINDALFMVPDADLFTFGLMATRTHMDWMRLTGGRLKSDYRYNKELTYNTFPWLDRAKLTPKQVQNVVSAAQAVLDARAAHPKSTLSDLYDPLTMPRDLRAAHNALDKTVDNLYGIKSGATEAQRLAHLLALYQAATPTLISSTAKPTSRRRKATL